ncbi:MAG: hypothetical protein R3F43_17050 [bacterium]
MHLQERRPFEFTRSLKLPGAERRRRGRPPRRRRAHHPPSKRPVAQPRAISVHVAQ